ncbi:MAG TPA: hypothetical protein VJ951_03565 [Bacteroidales bacterium]|nr:hypothetical protein [Bacteroidales bacterium]
MKISIISISAIAMLMMYSCGNNKTQQLEKVEISIEKDTYKPGEKDALIVLKAYADKDLETLKSYAGFAHSNALDEDYFTTNSGVSSFREKIATWNGSFDKIRYKKEEINFQVVYNMVAVFYENPENEQLAAIGLRTLDSA